MNVERATSKLPAEGEAPQDAEQHAQQSASQQACPEAQAEGLASRGGLLHLLGISGQGSCVTASATNCRRPSKKAVRSPAFGYVSDSESEERIGAISLCVKYCVPGYDINFVG